MGVDEGNLQVILYLVDNGDVMILENYPISVVRKLLACTVLYSTAQHHIISIILVYYNKCHRTIPQYIMTYSVVHKNVMTL